jgi:hypothetical protein
MFLRNCWYVAGWSHDIAADSLVSRTMLGEPTLADPTPIPSPVLPTKERGNGNQTKRLATFRQAAGGLFHRRGQRGPAGHCEKRSDEAISVG